MLRTRLASPSFVKTVLMIVCGFALSMSAFANDVGQVKTVKGIAYIERGGEKITAQPGAKILQSDVIVTGADGSVGISFVDNSTISTGPNSVLAIDRFTFDATTHIGAFDASLRKGTLAAVSGKISKQTPEAMKIHTPTAILGVRGTEFVVRADDPAK